MDGKRPANGEDHEHQPPKRAKTGEGPGPTKPALNLEAMRKAKALLERQKQLKEKLKEKLPLAAGAPGGGAAALPSRAAAAAAGANPLAPGGLDAAAGGVDAVLVAAKAARAVEIASKFGVQASLASVPALVASAAGGAGLPGSAAAAAAGAVRPALGPGPVMAAGVRPALVAPPPGAGGGPRPLRLDAAGREVDEHGNVIQAVRAPIATSLINMPRPEPQRSPSPPPGPKDEDFIDTSLAGRPAGRGGGGGGGRHRGGAFVAGRGRGRRGGALEFVEEGSLQRQAEIARLKAKYGEADFRKHLPPHLRRPPRGPAGPAERAPGAAAAAGGAAAAAAGAPDGDITGANLVPLGVREVEESEEQKLRKRVPEVASEPPGVEWWDKPLLDGGAYYTTAAAAADGAAGQQGDATEQPQPDEQPQHDQQRAPHHQEGQQEQQQQQPQAGDAEPAQADDDQHQQHQHHQQGPASRRTSVLAVAADGCEMRLRLGRLTRYVEHPVPLEPPDEGPPPAPQPLKLTKRELKKLRTQRRQAREKEKQELVRQGLLEPPKPKVKISNLMRVLGEQATLDPTAIEQEVRRQMSERQAAHDDRNLARCLTPAERRDKKLRKLFEGGAIGGAGGGAAGSSSSLAAVYRVERLDHGQHRFKVDVNAKENQMTGIMLVVPSSFSLVVVEGVPKALRRYHKLMLRRIDWATAPAAGPAAGDEGGPAGGDEDDEDGGQGADKPVNSCHLVWEGVVGSNAFKDFMKEEVATPEAARKLLEDRGVAHYWDAAAAFDADAAPLPSAVWER